MYQKYFFTLVFFFCSVYYRAYSETIYTVDKTIDSNIYLNGEKLINNNFYGGVKSIAKRYPEVIYLGEPEIIYRSHKAYVIPDFPWIIWQIVFPDDTVDKTIFDDLELPLLPTWFFFRAPIRSDISFKEDYFRDIFQAPEDNTIVRLRGILDIDRNTKYDRFLKRIQELKWVYEDEAPSQELNIVHRKTFTSEEGKQIISADSLWGKSVSRMISLEFKAKKSYIWYLVIFNKKGQIIGIQF